MSDAEELEAELTDPTGIGALDAEERRVLGVLIEKGLTTPQYYPLSLNALVSGCNQKSNRDPLVEYEEEQVDEVLERLKKRHLASVVYPAGGRTEKFRHELKSTIELDGQELAVLGELLLRGAQSIGDLRQRANRMKAIPDLATLEEVLECLMSREPALVVRLSPPGVKRGARFTHALYPADELAKIRAEAGQAEAAAGESVGRSSGSTSRPSGVAALEARMESLERRVAELESRLGVEAEHGRDHGEQGTGHLVD